MHIRAKQGLMAVATLMLAFPVWARTNKAQLTVTQSTTIAGKELKPGNYNLEVKENDTQLKVIDADNGKVVAQVPVQWITLKDKANTSAVIVNENQVTEVDFGGKTQAIRVGETVDKGS